MRTRMVLAAAALAGGLLLVPAAMEKANAAHGFGGGGFGGGGHLGGGMGGHFSGGPHFAGGGGGRFGGPMGGPHFAAGSWHGGPGWNGGRAVWHGTNWRGNNWHDHEHDQFVHDHDHFRNRFIAVGGWWPGYYGYGYGYGGCSWLYDQAVYAGSSYWWNRYYACANYY